MKQVLALSQEKLENGDKFKRSKTFNASTTDSRFFINPKYFNTGFRCASFQNRNKIFSNKKIN